MMSQWEHYKQDFEQFANAYVANYATPSARLKDAIAYSFLNGGKRIRALMTYMVAEMLSLDRETTRHLALSIEAMHACSLIHDDLPAMDDDDLRRGKPTCHIQFDEATAILAGDALQTIAFEALAGIKNIDIAQLQQLISTLANCAGAQGMIAGQQLDLDAEDKQVALIHLEQIHHYKTGKMFIASLRLPLIASQYYQQSNYHQALDNYGSSIGLAFQIKDDILDITADTETLGKNAQSDLKHAKSTYPALLGLVGAEEHLDQQIANAQQALKSLHQHDTQPLSFLATYIGTRSF